MLNEKVFIAFRAIFRFVAFNAQ